MVFTWYYYIILKLFHSVAHIYFPAHTTHGENQEVDTWNKYIQGHCQGQVGKADEGYRMPL